MEMALHGAYGPPANLGRFGEREPLKVDQDEHDALSFGEALHGVLDRRPQDGVSNDLPSCRLGPENPQDSVADVAATVMAEGSPSYDTKEPSLQAVRVANPIQPLRGLEEGLLHDLFGGGSIRSGQLPSHSNRSLPFVRSQTLEGQREPRQGP